MCAYDWCPADVTMTSGFSTIAGSVLAAYINLGVPAQNLVTSSVMSIPASIAISKMRMPEVEEPITRGQVVVDRGKQESAPVNMFLISLHWRSLTRVKGKRSPCVQSGSIVRPVCRWTNPVSPVFLFQVFRVYSYVFFIAVLMCSPCFPSLLRMLCCRTRKLCGHLSCLQQD